MQIDWGENDMETLNALQPPRDDMVMESKSSACAATIDELLVAQALDIR